MRRLLLAAACAALVPAALAAQDTTLTDEPIEPVGTGARRPFIVVPSVGVQHHDAHSAFQSPSLVGAIDVTYRITQAIGLGLTASASRPETDATYFPLVRQQAGDTSLYYRVSQRVTEYTYGVQGVVSFPLGRFAPYVNAGVGRYTYTLDPQAVGAPSRYSGPMFSFGGGVSVPMGRAGLTLDVRDVVFASFERERLDATDPLFRDTRFDPVPAGKPEPRSTVHAPRIAIGVSFVPASKEGDQ